MKISVIIPTLNEEYYIGRLLQQLVEYSSNEDFEVIVVDGGSTDETTKIVSEYAVKLFKATVSSRAHQMNLGASHAKNDVLYFVHADVQLPPSFLNDIEQTISQGYEAGCYRFRFYHKPNPLLHINDFFTRFPFKWCRGGDQTLFVKRDLFNSLGGFNEDYVIMEDYELLDRITPAYLFKVMPKSVGVSPRKYDKNGYLKVQLANLKAMTMYRKGLNPNLIKQYYQQALS